MDVEGAQIPHQRGGKEKEREAGKERKRHCHQRERLRLRGGDGKKPIP